MTAQMATYETEKEELAFFERLFSEGVVARALELVGACRRAAARVAERSYEEGDIMTRLVLLAGASSYQLRVHLWHSLAADESVWHSHQYPIRVQCLLGGGYRQQLATPVFIDHDDDDDAESWRAYRRIPLAEGHGFQTVEARAGRRRLRLTEEREQQVRGGDSYGMTTRELHRLESVTEGSATVTAVLRGRRHEEESIFLGHGDEQLDMYRRRQAIGPVQVMEVVQAVQQRLSSQERL